MRTWVNCWRTSMSGLLASPPVAAATNHETLFTMPGCAHVKVSIHTAVALALSSGRFSSVKFSTALGSSTVASASLSLREHSAQKCSATEQRRAGGKCKYWICFWTISPIKRARYCVLVTRMGGCKSRSLPPWASRPGPSEHVFFGHGTACRPFLSNWELSHSPSLNRWRWPIVTT
jgi:hypothetical protein